MGVFCPDRMLELDFSSVQFIFVFLPLTLFVYYLLPKACRNGVLAVFSLLFFALAGYRSAAVVLGAAFINWLGGLLLERAQRKKPLLVLLVGCNVAILAVMKYAPLLVETLNPLLGGSLPMVSAVLPVGMSFYLFTAIGYCADIAAGKAAAIKSPVRFFVFLAFFGHSLSGPIVRWEQQNPQLPCRSESRRVDADRFCAGIKRFVLGLSKKVLLEDQLALICARVTSVPAATLPAPILLLGYTAYMLQFYCEISGYADMAVGLGHFFGITLPESFDDPYCARSVTDFWHRWNIPLSDWFRDYVYIPLGGSRKGEGRACLNLLLVFALTGFWHGAAWKYLAFGAMHGVILCAERLGGKAARCAAARLHPGDAVADLCGVRCARYARGAGGAARRADLAKGCARVRVAGVCRHQAAADFCGGASAVRHFAKPAAPAEAGSARPERAVCAGDDRAGGAAVPLPYAGVGGYLQ